MLHHSAYSIRHQSMHPLQYALQIHIIPNRYRTLLLYRIRQLGVLFQVDHRRVVECEGKRLKGRKATNLEIKTYKINYLDGVHEGCVTRINQLNLKLEGLSSS